MMKFTAGPWYVMPEQVTGGYVVRPDGWSRGVCTVTQRDIHPILGMGINWDQARANAVLISLAPELLSTVDELVMVVKRLAQGQPVGNVDEIVQRADRLLNKVSNDE